MQVQDTIDLCMLEFKHGGEGGWWEKKGAHTEVFDSFIHFDTFDRAHKQHGMASCWWLCALCRGQLFSVSIINEFPKLAGNFKPGHTMAEHNSTCAANTMRNSISALVKLLVAGASEPAAAQLERNFQGETLPCSIFREITYCLSST